MDKPTLVENREISEWQRDRFQEVSLNFKRWVIIALVGWALNIVQTIALLVMVLSYKVELRVVQVEKDTGVTTVLTPPENGAYKSVTENEVSTKFWLNRYVLVRETYDPQDYKENYRAVQLMSSGDESKRYEDFMSETNPLSPVLRYNTTATRKVEVKSISFLNKQTAQVRFKTVERQNNSNREDYWVAILTYRYLQAPMSEKDRMEINPFGFQILTYRTDQEVIHE